MDTRDRTDVTRGRIRQQQERWMKERQLELDKEAAGIENRVRSNANSADVLNQLTLKITERIEDELKQKYKDGKGIKTTTEDNSHTLKSEIMSNTCPICLELLLPPTHSPIILFPCGHTFCKVCLEQQKKVYKNKCACCRTPIKSQAVNLALQNLICAANNKEAYIQPVTLAPELPKQYEPDAERYEVELEGLKIRIDALSGEGDNAKQQIRNIEGQLQRVEDEVKRTERQHKQLSLKIKELQKEDDEVSKHLNDLLIKQDKLQAERTKHKESAELIVSTLESLFKERDKLEILIRNKSSY